MQVPSWNVVFIDKNGGKSYRLAGMTEPKARAEFEKQNPTKGQVVLTYQHRAIDWKPKEKPSES